jgi:hypothetical protein
MSHSLSNLSRVKIIKIEEITINNTNHMAATRWEVKRGHQIQAKVSRCKAMDITTEAIEATTGVKIKGASTRAGVAAEGTITVAITEVGSSREVEADHT